MIDCQTPLQHHLFEIAITERIAQIPANAQQNDVSLGYCQLVGRNISVLLSWKEKRNGRQRGSGENDQLCDHLCGGYLIPYQEPALYNGTIFLGTRIGVFEAGNAERLDQMQRESVEPVLPI